MEVISYDKQSLLNNVNILKNLLIIHKCTVTSSHIRWLKDGNDDIRWLKDGNDAIDDDEKNNNKYDELQVNKENEDDEIIPSPNEQHLSYRTQKFFPSYKSSGIRFVFLLLKSDVRICLGNDILSLNVKF